MARPCYHRKAKTTFIRWDSRNRDDLPGKVSISDPIYPDHRSLLFPNQRSRIPLDTKMSSEHHCLPPLLSGSLIIRRKELRVLLHVLHAGDLPLGSANDEEDIGWAYDSNRQSERARRYESSVGLDLL